MSEYALALSDAEVRRYTMMAEHARANSIIFCAARPTTATVGGPGGHGGRGGGDRTRRRPGGGRVLTDGRGRATVSRLMPVRPTPLILGEFSSRR